MQLNSHIYDQMRAVDWLNACGREPSVAFRFSVEWLANPAEAVALALGAPWWDARTEAQGDLTGSLAKHDYDAYSYWNQLVSRVSPHHRQPNHAGRGSGITSHQCVIVARRYRSRSQSNCLVCHLLERRHTSARLLSVSVACLSVGSSPMWLDWRPRGLAKGATCRLLVTGGSAKAREIDVPDGAQIVLKIPPEGQP
jgi:hypothetical protein